MSTSWVQYIRNIVATAIETRRVATDFVDNSFSVNQTYYPTAQLEQIAAQSRVYVVGLAMDQSRLTRGPTYEGVQPIQIAFQAVITGGPTDLAEADTYAQLMEELKETTATCMDTIGGVSWQSNDALRDPSGGIVAYEGIREASTFEHYFTANYMFATTQGCVPPG